MRGEEFSTGCGYVAGKVAVASDEEERGGIEKGERDCPLHEAKPKGRYFTGRIKAAELVGAGDGDDPGNGPPERGVITAVGQEGEDAFAEKPEESGKCGVGGEYGEGGLQDERTRILSFCGKFRSKGEKREDESSS